MRKKNPKSILESAKNQISETEALKQDFQHLQKEAQNLKKWDIKAREANEKKMLDNLNAREARIKKQAEQELGRSLDEDKIYYELYQTGKIKYKQLNEMQKEIREAYGDWWEKQIKKGNKELLEYNKDVEAYHKLTDSIGIDKDMQEKVDEFKNWQKKHLHEMTNRTDEQIIKEQMKKMDKPYDEVKETLRFARRQMELRLNLHPLSEFGINYAEFYQDGKGTIAKLIAEANAAKQAGQDFSGQVAGAFSKEIDGAEASIDLVWGNEKMGLQKIAQKHLDDFANFSGATPQEKLANGLSEIVLKGVVSKTYNGYNIKFNDFVVGLNKGWNEKGVKTGDNKWIVTAFDNSKEISKKATAANFTEGAAQPNNPASEIIAKIQEKMKVSKEYAENLAKWHKDSHPITKEADGTPKVFYHGIRNGTPFEIFDMKKSKNNLGFFFTDKKEVANFYANQNKESKNTYEIFLNIKNPFDLSKPINSTKDLKNLENIGILPPLTKEQKDEFFRLKKIKDEAIKDLKKQGIDLIEISGSWAYGTKNGKLFEFLEAYKDYRGFYTNNGGTITILKPEQMKLYTPAVKQFFKETRWGFYRNDFDLLLSGEYIEALGGISNGYGFDTLKTLLNKKGYDGIKVSDYEVVVFDSNQIKAVGNKGTFNATNPNIYHSSSTAGGGVLGGSIAGVERDEEGNIVGFSPEKFALGFASGAAGAKALSKITNSKIAQNLASKAKQNLANSKAITLSQKSIQKLATNPRAKAILEKIHIKSDIIPALEKGEQVKEADIISKFIKDNELDYTQMGEISTLPAMQKYKDFMDSFLNSKNIKKLSQNKIAMQTPAGEVKIYLPYAYGHFHKNGKFGNKKEKRNNLTGALKEILTNPLFVTKDKRGSLYFYKPFRDKENILDLISVSVDKEGKIQYKTTYADKYKQVLDLVKNNELVYIRS